VRPTRSDLTMGPVVESVMDVIGQQPMPRRRAPDSGVLLTAYVTARRRGENSRFPARIAKVGLIWNAPINSNSTANICYLGLTLKQVFDRIGLILVNTEPC
jgi:hypothetical protein